MVRVAEATVVGDADAVLGHCIHPGKCRLAFFPCVQDLRSAIEAFGFRTGSLSRALTPSSSMTAQHADHAGRLPRHHDDPFDRMLIAQAKLEGLHLVTRDSMFKAYGIPLLPA